MSLMLTRILAYFTLVSYLVVGTAAVRFFLPRNVSLSFNTQYYSVFTVSSIKASTVDIVSAPEIVFAKIEMPKEEVKVVTKKVVKKVAARKVVKKIQEVKIAKNELPFNEPVKLSAVKFDYSLPTNLIALYKDIKVEERKAMVAESAKALEAEDAVSTTMAKVQTPSADAEPEFFDYAKAPVTESKVITNSVEGNKTEVKSLEESKDDIVAFNYSKDETIPTEVSPSSSAYEEISMDDLVTFDYSKPSQESAPKTVSPSPVNAGVSGGVISTTPIVNTQAAINFDYSRAIENAKQNGPTVASSGYPTTSSATAVNMGKQVNQNEYAVPNDHFSQSKGNDVISNSQGYATQLTIQMTSMNFKKLSPLNGFEVRFQDDQSLSLEDYGSGEVVLKDQLAQPKMTRSVTLLKRGHAPVSTDVILEEGVSQVSIPTIDEENFNKLLEAYESRGPVGALLVELDDETEVAQLDVPFGRVMTLDGDLKETKKDDFRYQLFLGVQAGNALLTYKSSNGDKSSKVVHIHERELTFDANYFESTGVQKVTLLEEDLLAKDHSPLIVASDDVKVFATSNSATKMDDRSYQLDFNKTHLGGRQYIELAHQIEPVFIGLRENKTVLVPSENFMRYILSNFEGGKLGNRCIVQVNLSKKIEKVDVGSESVGANLMAYTQVLDSNGKFYESASDKSQKVIILGENQGVPGTNQDGRIDIKIQYQDGTNQYLNTYCSPNSYLVEQL